MFGCERKRPLYCLSQQAQLEGLWAVELMPPGHHNSQDPSKNSSLASCGPLHWVWTPVGDLSWGADTRLPPGAPPSGACQSPSPSQALPLRTQVQACARLGHAKSILHYLRLLPSESFPISENRNPCILLQPKYLQAVFTGYVEL